MARVISIHEYDLKPGADVAAFEQAVRDAERRGLFALAGLVEHHFLKGIKGVRRERVARFGFLRVARRGKSSGVAWKPHVHPLNIQRRGRSGRTKSSHPSWPGIPTRSASRATKNCEIRPRPPWDKKIRAWACPPSGLRINLD